MAGEKNVRSRPTTPKVKPPKVAAEPAGTKVVLYLATDEDVKKLYSLALGEAGPVMRQVAEQLAPVCAAMAARDKAARKAKDIAEKGHE